MKRIICILAAVILLSLCVIPVSASTANVFDEIDLLTQDQQNSLQEKIDDINKDAEFTTYIIIVNDLGGQTVEQFTEQYQQQHDLSDDCAMMVVAMQSRDVDIAAKGKGENALDQNRREEIYDDMYDYLHSGDYYKAFSVFLDGVKKYSHPYVPFTWVLISLAIGFIIALIVSNSLKKQLKTVEFQRDAKPYVKAGSMNLRKSSDQFLYFTISRVARPKNNGGKGGMHSSGGGGGSFGHTSGKF